MAQLQGWSPVADKRGQKNNRVPPFAPSPAELSFYQKYIDRVALNKSLPRRALILGATPELRDLAIMAGLECVAVDISAEMITKFSALMQHAGGPLDKPQEGNWLEMNFPEHHFGIVMGDASFINLTTKEENERLTQICAQTTASDGFVVLRQAVFGDDDQSYESADHLLEDYSKGLIKWEDLFMELRMVMFRSRVYNQSTFQYDARRAFLLIDELSTNGQIPSAEYDHINTFRNEVINTFYSREAFFNMFAQFGLKLEETFHDTGFLFFKYLFMMAFHKKEN